MFSQITSYKGLIFFPFIFFQIDNPAGGVAVPKGKFPIFFFGTHET